MQQWEQRYHATAISAAATAANNKQRGLVASNQTDVTQLYAWDLPSGGLRQLTQVPSGKAAGFIAPNGKYVVYMQDTRGNEQGQLVRVPWDGGEPQLLTPDFATYGITGLGFSGDGHRLGFIAYRSDGFRLHIGAVSDTGELSELREIWHDVRATGDVKLSQDGKLVAIGNAQATGSTRRSCIVLDADAGDEVATLRDDVGTFSAWGFLPQSDSHDLIGTTDKSGFHRPFVWNPSTQAYRDIVLPELAGDVRVAAVSAQGVMLLANVDQAHMGLYTYDLRTDALKRLKHESGVYMGGGFLDEQTVYTLWENAVQPRSVVALDVQTGERTATLLAAGEVPAGRPWRSITFASSDNAEIQAWLAVPEGDGPFPTILHTHGGPTAVMMEFFSAEAQAYLDHGFAWCSVNYRGSTTFGRDFERVIYGNLGVREVDDMAAARDWLISNGVSTPDQFILTGRSYGGFLTLQAAGRAPALWAAGIGDVAIGDWNLMYEDQAEGIRQYQASILGLPEDNPVNYAIASPITYAAAVRAPLLVIQGESDPRCPPRQLKAYEQRLKDLGKPIEVVWYDAGHSSYDMALKVEHQRLRLDFALRILDGFE